MRDNKIGIIGAGNMGEALLAQNQISNIKNQKYIFSEKNNRRRIFIQKKYRIQSLNDNKELVRQGDIIILAIKPQDFTKVLNEIRNTRCKIENKLFISIGAGITTKYIEDKIGAKPKVIRVMPNLPCVIKKGISAICLGRYAREKDFLATEKIFSNLGKVVRVKEAFMNAITALSGSGPAYFYYLIEALEDAAIRFGLNEKLARQLIVETGLGALELLKIKGIKPKELRRQITSKSGTTEAVVSIFNINELQEVIKDGLLLAVYRAKLLSELVEKR